MKKNLGEIVKMIRKQKGLTQPEVVKLMTEDYSATNLSRFERGEQGISQKRFRSLCNALGVSVSDAYSMADLGADLDLTIPGEDGGVTLVEFKTLPGGVSTKQMPLSDTSTGYHRFAKTTDVLIPYFEDLLISTGEKMQEILKRNKQQETLRFKEGFFADFDVQEGDVIGVRLNGNNMEPKIPEGATVLINTKATKIQPGKIYLINHDGLARIVILYPMPGGALRISNTNSTEYQEEILNKDQAEGDVVVLGRAFFYSATL